MTSVTTATTSRGQAVEVFQADGDSVSNFQYSRYGAPDSEDEAKIQTSITEKQLGQGLVFDEDILEEGGMVGAKAGKLADLKARLMDRSGYLAAKKQLADTQEAKRAHRLAVMKAREKQQLQLGEAQKQKPTSSGAQSLCHGLGGVDMDALQQMKSRLDVVSAKVTTTGAAGAGSSATQVASDIEAFHRHIILLQAGVATELTARIEQATKVIQHVGDKRKSSMWATARNATTSGTLTSSEGGHPHVIESSLTPLEKDKLSTVCKQLADLKNFPELVSQQEQHLATLRPVHEAALAIVEDVEFYLGAKPFQGAAARAIQQRTNFLSDQFKQNTEVMDTSLSKLREMMKGVDAVVDDWELC